MSDAKIKHQVTVTVLEDDTVDYKFEGVDGWPIGKMQRQLNRAPRFMKAEQRKVRLERLRAEERAKREAEEALTEEQRAARDLERQIDALQRKIRKAEDGNHIELADSLKEQLRELQMKEERRHAPDRRTDRRDAGKSAEDDGNPVEQPGGAAEGSGESDPGEQQGDKRGGQGGDARTSRKPRFAE